MTEHQSAFAAVNAPQGATSEAHPFEPISTGNPGLDAVLHGGLQPGRSYLLQGDAGAGKTTLALEFAMEGARRGEPVLLVALGESVKELEMVAASHGWSLEGITIASFGRSGGDLDPSSQYTVFQPAEVELATALNTLRERADGLRPARIVVDSLSDLRTMSQNSSRFRNHVQNLKDYFAKLNATSILIDHRLDNREEGHLHSLAHGVIILERVTPDYGPERRRLQVLKMRAQHYSAGYHDFRIVRGGLRIFPSIDPQGATDDRNLGMIVSGLSELDVLLGGGLDRGTSTLLLGPAGSGKSTMVLQYIQHAADAGERSVIFAFDETRRTFIRRAESLGYDLHGHLESGLVTVHQVDPAQMSPGEFADAARSAVDGGARIVVIDSLNGYLNAMPDERHLIIHLHDLLKLLANRKVSTFLVSSQAGVLGTSVAAPVDTTYLADTVLLFRFFEAGGAIRRALSVVKRRAGAHERTIRELSIGPIGLSVGEPLVQFEGVLTGTPFKVDGRKHEG